jgi:protein tyrosine/serine phosphatase
MAIKVLRLAAVSFLFVVSLATAGFSQTSPSKDFPNIRISNFGRMDERFYRGAQPKKGSYEALKALGIHTVIDLQAKPKGYERSEVEALGMKYINIPMPGKEYPSDENVSLFLKTVDDPETGVFYVHCAGGRHRTGDMGAVYRFTKYGWDLDRVYAEMKNYDFYTSHGHGKMKDFVFDYAAKIQEQKAAAASSQPSASTATNK